MILAIMACFLLVCTSTSIFRAHNDHLYQIEANVAINSLALSERVEQANNTNKTKEEAQEGDALVMGGLLAKAKHEANEKTTHNQHRPRFAYAFLIAGCTPLRPTYRGYIYNVAVAKYILSYHNSTADVVVMVRMHKDTNHTALPPEDEALLTRMGVKVKYIPKPVTDNFHTAMMDKFRILEMTEYDRVLYLDADVMPLCNLDFMFEKSMGPNAHLESNVVLAYNHEPSSGGFFMLEPTEKAYDEISKIILNGEEQGYHFNETKGFGHVITPPDRWESLRHSGTKWNFYGAFTDQGLLYHWTKYVKKQVTIIKGRTVKTFRADVNGDVQIVKNEPYKHVFGDIDVPLGKLNMMSHGMKNVVPYRGFIHFTENHKPWFSKVSRNPPSDVRYMEEAESGVQLWYHVLRKIIKMHKVKINADKISIARPILGLYPTNAMVMWTKQAREKLKRRLL